MSRVIAVTGAAGFVGRAIVARLARAGWQVRAVMRGRDVIEGAAETMAAGDLLSADLPALVKGCDAVVHCAARVHVMQREDAGQAELIYRRMNVDLPLGLAHAAKAAGVLRFVQLSSAAAIASHSASGEIITDATVPRPENPYGRSKLAADEALAGLASQSFKVVSLRPPAIYGPGVGAYFAMLDRAARAGLPLPVGGIANRRSFAFVGNVADAVECSLRADLSGAWLVTDSAPISTAELYRRLLALHGHGDRVWRWPSALAWRVARVVLGDRAKSLLGYAAFDGSRFASDFNWIAPTSLDEALSLTVRPGSA